MPSGCHRLSLRAFLKPAGVPYLQEALAEARECIRQTRTESVRRHPQLVEHLMMRVVVITARLLRASGTGAQYTKAPFLFDCLHEGLHTV